MPIWDIKRCCEEFLYIIENGKNMRIIDTCTYDRGMGGRGWSLVNVHKLVGRKKRYHNKYKKKSVFFSYKLKHRYRI